MFTTRMLGASLLVASVLSAATPAVAAPKPYPAAFKVQDIQANGTTLHVRVGGSGPAVVLIHGFGDTGDMWTPLAVELAKDHRVVVPDLRGLGLSAKPEGGYDKKNQAADIRAVLDKLGIDRADIVGHDIGTMVAYAYAASYPDKTTKLVVMDAPVPSIPPWDQIDEATREHYAKLYSRPGAMKASFAQFQSIRKDAVDNVELMKTKLSMPVLAIGGEKSFGGTQAVVMRNAATNVTELVVPGAGHWLMEEAPAVTIQAVKDFLAAT